ncbi:hypothetical protein K435DRAFT_627716, partial [Dendrothele bispora CBS 962.96]
PHQSFVDTIKCRLQALRDTKSPVSVITARAIMLGTIMEMAPEILDYTDSSHFQASESFIRDFLHDMLRWASRKDTRAAHKLPN